MSSPNEPANNPKPVVKDKNPHNYRKVGYSMIIISVSLVAIGLISWNLADNYHFSTNIMALQEVDAMTPKSGYNVVLFDISQPVGAKLKMLDHADTLENALPLQSQDEQQNNGSTMQVLLFNGSKDYNLNLMSDAEVFIQTPKLGYNVILDNYPLAVGAQLTLASHEQTYANATDYEKQQEDQIQGQQIKVLIFTPNFADNLKMVTGSSTPVGAYALLANQTSMISNETQTTGNQTAYAASTNGTNATSAQLPTTIRSNQTVGVARNQSTTVITNQTAILPKTNMTETTNMTTNMTTNENQTNVSQKTNLNVATTNARSNISVIISNGASATKGTCNTTDCFNPQIINIKIGNTVTWTNADTVGHTATSGKLTDNQTGTVFDSSLIGAGKSYTSPPFKTAGTYGYFCQVHPWMTGQVIVESVGYNQSSNNVVGTTKSVNLNETINVNANSK